MANNRIYLDNDEATEAWNGVLFDRFTQFRHIVTTGLGLHGEQALRLHPPDEGDDVLDIGCGFGDTTQQLCDLVGANGSATGVDVAERFIETSRDEATAAGIENIGFAVADVQAEVPGGPYDYAFSRMGTMFFANPGAAMRNVRKSLRPGGSLCMVVWRQKPDNPWMYRAEQTVSEWIDEPDPDESDEPTCGPGPFSMANADTTSGILLSAGFENIALCRCDLPIKIGDDIDEAVSLATSIGPAGEVIRLAGDEAEALRPQIETALRDALSEFASERGVIAGASTWIVSASAPL